MPFQRAERVAEEMKREVARILRDELKDPRLGFVTVTGVELSTDLRYAKIYVSILGQPAEREKTMAALEHATGFVRRSLGQVLHLRHTPEISFRYDSSIEHGARIAELISHVKDEGGD